MGAYSSKHEPKVVGGDIPQWALFREGTVIWDPCPHRCAHGDLGIGCYVYACDSMQIKFNTYKRHPGMQ